METAARRCHRTMLDAWYEGCIRIAAFVLLATPEFCICVVYV